MNKFLRFSVLAILAIVCNASFAQTVIWQEDWSTATKDQTPTEVKPNYTFENGGGTTKIYNEALAGGTAPELFLCTALRQRTAAVTSGASQRRARQFPLPAR